MENLTTGEVSTLTLISNKARIGSQNTVLKLNTRQVQVTIVFIVDSTISENDVIFTTPYEMRTVALFPIRRDDGYCAVIGNTNERSNQILALAGGLQSGAYRGTFTYIKSED